LADRLAKEFNPEDVLRGACVAWDVKSEPETDASGSPGRGESWAVSQGRRFQMLVKKSQREPPGAVLRYSVSQQMTAEPLTARKKSSGRWATQENGGLRESAWGVIHGRIAWRSIV
jgi:hypothetical protein